MGTRPAAGAGFGEQAHLQRGEIAVAHPLCAAFDRSGNGFVGQALQDAGEAIATTGEHHHVCTTGGST